MTYSPAAISTGNPPSSRRVLLAEDQASYRVHMAGLLTANGLQVDTAVDGREAILLIETGTAYNLLVTDLQMPHYTGFEVVEAWLRAGNSARTAIMVTGAAGSTAVRMRCAATGICLLSKADIGMRLEREVRRLLASGS